MTNSGNVSRRSPPSSCTPQRPENQQKPANKPKHYSKLGANNSYGRGLGGGVGGPGSAFGGPGVGFQGISSGKPLLK